MGLNLVRIQRTAENQPEEAAGVGASIEKDF
jgi:hypothetical protein